MPDILLEEFEDPSSGPEAGHTELLIGVRCTFRCRSRVFKVKNRMYVRSLPQENFMTFDFV